MVMFHLYQGSQGDGDGLSTHALLTGSQIGNQSVPPIALMNWEQGMCDDVISQGANDWWEFVRQSPRAAIHHALPEGRKGFWVRMETRTAKDYDGEESYAIERFFACTNSASNTRTPGWNWSWN